MVKIFDKTHILFAKKVIYEVNVKIIMSCNNCGLKIDNCLYKNIICF